MMSERTPGLTGTDSRTDSKRLMADGGLFNQASAEPPTIARASHLEVHTPGGTKTIGWLGSIPERSGSGVLMDRDSHHHRIRAMDAYAISYSALDRMDDADVDFILIRETDTGDVYEWKYLTFRYADEVPDRFLDHVEDPQRYCSRDSARAIWKSYGDAVEREPRMK